MLCSKNGICLPMEHLGVHENSLKRVHAFQIAVPREKPFGARERTNNKLNPHMLSTQDSNLHHNGGRRTLSPLLHLCSPKINYLTSSSKKYKKIKMENLYVDIET